MLLQHASASLFASRAGARALQPVGFSEIGAGWLLSPSITKRQQHSGRPVVREMAFHVLVGSVRSRSSPPAQSCLTRAGKGRFSRTAPSKETDRQVGASEAVPYSFTVPRMQALGLSVNG